jgi:Squalene-hopene cyclase C-terminal domain/Prenyltransferase and squalene oxidase repeat
MTSWRIVSALVLAALVLSLTHSARAADAGPDPKDLQAVSDKAIAYLRKTQESDGSWSAKQTGPGVTALVVAALLRHGVSPQDPTVAKALGYLEKAVQKNGGIYTNDRLVNYTTSVGLMAFQEANQDKKYDAVIKKATDYLKGLQRHDDDKDARFGGVGYNDKTRPDMSNTAFFVDALIAAGVAKDDPAIQRALKFVSRCQNLPGETNDQPFAKKTTDDDKGGLTYYPTDIDDNPHKTPDGGLRSLGAMTYGGLKSFLYAGVSKDDPRVQGAVKWIRRHYTLEENPGMKQAGLFYYYHTFGKAMAALGEDPFEDANGKKHDWRKELFEALKKRQREDGSFINSGDRTFGEADPNLATAFALLSLTYTNAAKR